MIWFTLMNFKLAEITFFKDFDIKKTNTVKVDL